MNKKGSLFNLIKSLTPPEKRYFKLYCKMHQASSNHIRLFEAMDKQARLDDNEIRMQFKGERFLNQLHVTKNYLQSLILKCLRNYNSNISKEFEIRNLLFDAEILYTKELFDQCYYSLEKAEKLALKFDDFTALVDIYDWQRKLSTTKSGAGGLKSTELLKDQEYAINELQKISNCWRLITTSSIYNGNVSEDSNENLDDSLDENGSLTYKILRNYYRFSKTMMSRQGNDSELYLNKTLDLLEQNPERISNSPNTYVTTLGNKVPLLLYQKRWKEALDILQKLRQVGESFKLSKSKFSIRTVCRSYNLELEIYRDKKDFEKGISRIEEVQHFIETNAIPEDYLILFWNQFAQLYFGNGQYERSLEWVNRMLDLKNDSWRGITSHARVLHLMIHYELGNMIFIRYAVESHRRYLKKFKSFGKFERISIKYLLKAAKAPLRSRVLELNKLYAILFDEKEPVATTDNLDYLDIKTWLEAKTSA